MLVQKELSVTTKGRGTYDLTQEVQGLVSGAGVVIGLCHLFLHHTSASIILCENADPVVRRDLERFMLHLVPDGDPMFAHTQEGPDDMPAHIRTILTQYELTIPVKNYYCALGTWQGIYLWEHRTGSYRRTITISIQGAD